MSDKRRDSKGRLLKQGERQREDGKYEYRYYDEKGGRHSVYSWRLVDTDRIPPGKRDAESLRSMEKRIRRDLEDGIKTHEADRTTLNYHYDRYIAQKIEIKESTRENYKYMYDKYVRYLNQPENGGCEANTLQIPRFFLGRSDDIKMMLQVSNRMSESTLLTSAL